MKIRKSAGFTLIELLVVIAIIGVLASLIIVSLTGAQKKARDTQVKNNARTIDTALAQYRIDNNEVYFHDTNSITAGGMAIATGSTLATNLTNYIKTTATAFNPGTLVAKYATNYSGSRYVQAWQLNTSNEAAVTSGNGIYATKSAGVAGNVVSLANSNGLAVDGVNNVVTIANTASLQIVGNLTVAFWINSTTLVDNKVILEKSGEYSLTEMANGAIVFTHTGNTQTVCSAGTLVAGSWTHIIVTRNATGLALNCYKNGVASGSGTYTTAPSATTNNLTVGKSGSAGFVGVIDDVRIYNTVLTSSTTPSVADLYGSGLGAYIVAGESTGLVGAWRFDEGTGTTATGVVGGNGTITGASWVDGRGPLGLTGIGSSATGRAFVTYGPQ